MKKLNSYLNQQRKLSVQSSFIGEFYQTWKDSTRIWKRTLSNMTLKLDKNTTAKKTKIPEKVRYKIPQENIGKLNLAIYSRDDVS